CDRQWLDNRGNDEIRMTNVELITKSEGCGTLPPRRRDVDNRGCAKVERVVLNALQKTAALPPDTCVCGDQTPIVFREADPPWARHAYPLTSAEATITSWLWLQASLLVVPSPRRRERESTDQANDVYAASSLDIRYSSFSRHMSVPRVDEELRYLRQAMIA